MKTSVLFLSCGIILGILAPFHLRADQLEMQNGDRYVGKVLSVTADTVVLQNEVLGKINVPRSKVTSLAFGTNVVAPKAANTATVSTSTNLPDVVALTELAKGDTNLSTTIANSELVRQLREQVAGSPEATGKFNELMNGFLTGKLNVNDIRREAKSSADQLRELKRELGPEASESLDSYLKILDGFLNESETAPTSKPSAAQPKTPGR